MSGMRKINKLSASKTKLGKDSYIEDEDDVLDFDQDIEETIADNDKNTLDSNIQPESE